MKQLAFILIFCLATFSVYAQNSAVNKATRFEESGDLAQAKQNIDEAIEHEKTRDKGKTWYTKGTIYEAIAVSEDPQQQALAENALQEAVAAYQKAKELEEENSGTYVFADQRLEGLWGTFLNKGAELYQAGNYSEALENFEKAKMLKPQDTTAYLYGGISAQQEGNMELALENYHKLIELDINDPSIYESVVYLERAENEDNEKALEIVTLAREKFPENENLAKEEISLLIITEQTDEASKKLEQAIAVEPDNALLYYNLGFLYDQMGDQAKEAGDTTEARVQKDKAIEQYKEAIEREPDNFEANFNTAVNYYNRAAALVTTANEMDLKQFQQNGGKLMEQSKVDFNNALPYLEKAREVQPDDVTVLTTLVTVYQQLGMDEKAEETNKHLETVSVPEEGAPEAEQE